MHFEHERQLKALAAARASHEQRTPCARTSKYTLKQAARDYGVGHKMVKDASALLLSDMDYLIADIEQGTKSVLMAYKEYSAVNTKDASKLPGPQGLYIIEERGGDGYMKIGKGRVATRFREHQSGNPRRLRLYAFWAFTDMAKCWEVEQKVLALGESAPGGNEWMRGVGANRVDQIVRSMTDGKTDGIRIARVDTFDFDGFQLRNVSE